MDTKDFAFTGQFERVRVADMLQDMAKAVRDGNVLLQRNGESLSLNPNDEVDLHVGAERDELNGSLQIRLEWNNS